MISAWCRSIRVGLLLGTVVVATGLSGCSPAAAAQPARPAWGAPEGQACVQCHVTQHPALVEEWRLGGHGQKGINCRA